MGLGYDEEMYVLDYGNNLYLIFDSAWDSRITAYQIQDGILTGGLCIDYECTDVVCEVAYCTSGMEGSAEKLQESAWEYYDASYSEDLFKGNAEDYLDEETPEYSFLKELGRQEAEEYKSRYKERLGTNRIEFTSVMYKVSPITYQSDLDNDGEPELYAKASCYPLGIVVWGHKRERVYRYLTGELYGGGKHEGKYGLGYIMADQKQRTDFEQLCGLDIWSLDYVPQIFWVEKCGEENITFIKYFNQECLNCLIEAYCIKDGGYERVLSVEYHPEISISVVYDWPEEGEEGLSYTVHLLTNENLLYPVPILYGLQDENVVDEINAEMERLLYDEIEKFLLRKEGVAWNGGAVKVSHATEEELTLLYGIYYEEGEWGWKEDLYLDINLISGEVALRRDEN